MLFFLWNKDLIIQYKTEGFPASVLRAPCVTLKGLPLDSETGWTRKLWLKTYLLKWRKNKKIVFVFSLFSVNFFLFLLNLEIFGEKKIIFSDFFEIFCNFQIFDIFWHFLDFWGLIIIFSQFFFWEFCIFCGVFWIFFRLFFSDFHFFFLFSDFLDFFRFLGLFTNFILFRFFGFFSFSFYYFQTFQGQLLKFTKVTTKHQKCQMSHVTCQLSLTPTATARDLPLLTPSAGTAGYAAADLDRIKNIVKIVVTS